MYVCIYRVSFVFTIGTVGVVSIDNTAETYIPFVLISFYDCVNGPMCSQFDSRVGAHLNNIIITS